MQKCPKCSKQTNNITLINALLGKEIRFACSCGYKRIQYVSNSKIWGSK